MISRKIIIPNVPKEERETLEIGYHNIPDWQLYVFGIVIIGLYVGFIIK